MKFRFTSTIEHIRSTLAIDPTQYSLQVSPGRGASFGYALAGLLHMLRYAKNVRIQIAATLAVFMVCLWLSPGRIEWAILVLVISINWLTEFLNAAIEAAVNLASPEFHPMAQMAKDIAAAGALLAALTSLVIALLLLVPLLQEKL